MTTLYCPECGYKNEYTLHPPNFCGGCGEALGKTRSQNPPKIKTKASLRGGAKKQLPEGDDEETDIDYVPDIKKLDIDINYENQGVRVLKAGDLINAPGENADRS